MPNTLTPITPETEGRLVSTVQFFAFPQLQIADAESTGVTISLLLTGLGAASNQDTPLGRSMSAIKNAWGGFESMGQILNFKTDQTRTNERIYGLGRNAFEPRYIAPGKITTNITFEKVMLYKSEAIQWLGMTAGHLLYQTFPFVIYEYIPDIRSQLQVSVSNLAATTLPNDIHMFYTNCWFDTNPLDIDVEDDDQMISQNFKVTCGKVYVINQSIQGLASLANLVNESVQEFIPKTVPLKKLP